MSTLHLELPVELTKSEAYIKSKELSEALDQRRTLIAEKKLATGDYAKRVKELEKKIDDLGDTVRTGKEKRKVLCKERFNADKRTIETVRQDTKEIVSTRPLKDGDRQQALPGVNASQESLGIEGPGGDDDEDDEDEEDAATH